MQFRAIISVLSLFALSATSVSGTAVHGRATPAKRASSHQPSGLSNPWYSCAPTNKYNFGKVDELCDSPPHSGWTFGCTYSTGKGTGTHSCTYDSQTGECNGGDRDLCPETAVITRSHKKKRDLHEYDF
ncbi:hypothetical protein HMN09_00262300 [Mycena chlorophos]|uniref:Secreted protein n=1 Tax=Mycena chlorophos TaxID=658473 RepID=A0A8H6WLL4_MYCCL|nr:hypothetical protein HMN09_00262300 [Mycena chlorophos]